MKSGKSKSLLVGWDSVSWNFVDQLLEEGNLPRLQKLIDRGTKGTLRSTMPAITPVAWSSVITGKQPQKHGVYDWVRTDRGSTKAYTANDVKGTSFWQRLNDSGVKVGLVNIPLTYPTPAIDGFVICGLGAPPPPSAITYPPELLGQIEEVFGPYRPSLSTNETETLGSQQRIVEEEAAVQSRQVELALFAASNFQVDVLAINLILFDHTNHRAQSTELIRQSLMTMDDHLGQLIDGFGPDNILLFGDHGARRIRGQFLFGDWLCEQGYMARKEKQQQSKKELNFLLIHYLEGRNGLANFTGSVLRPLLREVIPFLPQSFLKRFWKNVKRRTPLAYNHYWYSEEIDSETSPILDLRSVGTLYLNSRVMGRDNKSVDDLIDKLSSLVEPVSSKPIFRHIYGAGTLFGNEFAGHPPAIVLDYHGSGLALRKEQGIGLMERQRHFAYMEDNQDAGVWVWWGDHDLDGICIVSGTDFVKGRTPLNGKVVDIAPTLLHLYNVSIPEDFDGEVLQQAFAVRNPVTYQSGDKLEAEVLGPSEKIEADENDEILSHLRALGYVD